MPGVNIYFKGFSCSGSPVIDNCCLLATIGKEV